MQPLTAPPRDGFTEAQVTALLTAPDLEVDFGAELLAPDLTLIEDISADVSGGAIHRNNLADIHGTCDLTISRELAWGRDRIRPYMLLSSATAGVSGCRFNQGVYLPTTPDSTLGEFPQSWQLTGFDQLHLLQACTGDTYAAMAGENVLTKVRAFITAAGVLAPVLLASSGADKTLTADKVWWQTSSEAPTWLGMCNDLLKTIGYRGLWADQDGNLRSGPYIQPELRASEWTLTVGDLVTGIVAQDRAVVNDVWGVPNVFRYIRNGMDTAPVEGAGRYTVANATNGPSSVASVGRMVRAPVTYLDAVDQASLVTQGDRLSAAAMRVSEVITLKMSPFPCAGHFDIFTYSDPALGADRKVQGRSFDLPLDGSDMNYVVETI